MKDHEMDEVAYRAQKLSKNRGGVQMKVTEKEREYIVSKGFADEQVEVVAQFANKLNPFAKFEDNVDLIAEFTTNLKAVVVPEKKSATVRVSAWSRNDKKMSFTFQETSTGKVFVWEPKVAFRSGFHQDLTNASSNDEFSIAFTESGSEGNHTNIKNVRRKA